MDPLLPNPAPSSPPPVPSPLSNPGLGGQSDTASSPSQTTGKTGDSTNAKESAGAKPGSPQAKKLGLGIVIGIVAAAMLAWAVTAPVSVAPVPVVAPVAEGVEVVGTGGGERTERNDAGGGMFGIVVGSNPRGAPTYDYVSHQVADVNGTLSDVRMSGKGIRVVGFMSEGSAYKAMGGLVGDILVKYDKSMMVSFEALVAEHTGKKAGDIAVVQIVRNGKPMTLTGPLGDVRARGAVR